MYNFSKQLSKSQMNNIHGGVNRKEYCDMLDAMFQYQITNQTWTEEQWIAAADAWNANCT